MKQKTNDFLDAKKRVRKQILKLTGIELFEEVPKELSPDQDQELLNEAIKILIPRKQIKIYAADNEKRNDWLEQVLNIANSIARGGYLPTPRDLEPQNRQNHWTWWVKDPDNKRYYLGSSNDYWANIKDEAYGSIVIELNARYDNNDYFNRFGSMVIAVALGSYKKNVQVVDVIVR